MTNIYLSAKLDSEAGVLAKNYFKQCTKNQDKLDTLLKTKGYTIKSLYTDTESGAACAFRFEEGEPDGWVTPRGCAPSYFPKRLKANKGFIEQIKELPLRCNVGYCKALFSTSVLTFSGMSMIRGVAGGIYGDRVVVAFHDDNHMNDIKTNKNCKWPKGFRRIKESSYYRLKEKNQ